VSFDPFRPDDAGDFSASYEASEPLDPKESRRSLIVRIAASVVALALLVAAALVAVAIV